MVFSFNSHTEIDTNRRLTNKAKQAEEDIHLTPNNVAKNKMKKKIQIYITLK
jgi:hypothetical protein